MVVEEDRITLLNISDTLSTEYQSGSEPRPLAFRKWLIARGAGGQNILLGGFAGCVYSLILQM